MPLLWMLPPCPIFIGQEVNMPKLRVHNLSISVDGYAAGPNQDVDNPLGVGGPELHEWVFATRSGRRMLATNGGDEGLDDQFIAEGDVGIGATVMGRNMFGPIRGPWNDDQWSGWWGDDPPFHHPVFVVTHHPRASIPMQGGTTFHFVTDGIEAALERAFEAANGSDVRLGGGAATIQQYLRAGLIDEMHVAIVPVLLGSGERLFDHLDGSGGYECVKFVSSPSVSHIRLARKAK
jgi:dihydrofolate reductase